MTLEPHMIRFDRAGREALRKAYARAVDKGKLEFTHNGHLYMVDYAKYLLEYLDSQLGK